MADDLFSEVLDLLGARSSVSGGFIAGGRWAVRFPPPNLLKFFVAARGALWLSVDGEPAPVRLREGDVFLLVARRGLVLASDLAVPPLDGRALYAGTSHELRQLGDGDDVLFLGGHVVFESAHAQLFVDSLPHTLHVPADSPEAENLAWLIGRLVDEHRAARPGAFFASTQLAQLMFLQILRSYVAGAEPNVAGRLRLLADRRLAPALRAMHDRPGRPWTLDELARLAAMSRTAFAVYFKSIAGVAPLAYLTEWRMRLAERALAHDDASLASLAASLGYASESAFSTAFKRVTGTSPKTYRASARRRASPKLDVDA